MALTSDTNDLPNRPSVRRTGNGDHSRRRAGSRNPGCDFGRYYHTPGYGCDELVVDRLTEVQE